MMVLGAIGALAAAGPAEAQTVAGVTEQVRADSSPALVRDGPGDWPGNLRNAVQETLAPVYARLTQLLQPVANARLVWSGGARFEGVSSDEPRYWHDFALTFEAREPNVGSFASQRPTASPDDPFTGILLGPRRFTIPWLVAPENVFHAMPTLSLPPYGSMHLNLMAASIGGRSGSSAILGQLVYRF